MKKINLNLIKNLDPKKKKAAVIVVCCLCLVGTAVFAWIYSNREDIFKPIKHVWEKLDEDQMLTLEDDELGKTYGAPVVVDETPERIWNGGNN